MVERIHKIVCILEDGKVRREYETISEDGVVRDVEITEAERLAIFAKAHDVGMAAVSDAQIAQRKAEEERDSVKGQLESETARLEKEKIEVLVVAESAKAEAEEAKANARELATMLAEQVQAVEAKPE